LVAAVFANEPRLIQACATGDPHLATAQMISHDYAMVKADPRRQSAKIANFGLLFGGGADGLVAQARDLFDTEISKTEAVRMMEDYFNLYPGLKRTKNLAYRAMESKDPRVTVVNQVGFRRFLEGFNRKPTSWLNTWIQSTAAYGMKHSFMHLREAMLTPFILGQVYDEILFEFPEEDAEEFAAVAKDCMIRGMRDVIGQNVPVTVSVDIGRTWT
jgi:DNA polymerase-1